MIRSINDFPINSLFFFISYFFLLGGGGGGGGRGMGIKEGQAGSLIKDNLVAMVLPRL